MLDSVCDLDSHTHRSPRPRARTRRRAAPTASTWPMCRPRSLLTWCRMRRCTASTAPSRGRRDAALWAATWMASATSTRAAVRVLSRPSQAAAAERGSVTHSVAFFAILRVHKAPLTAWAGVSAWQAGHTEPVQLQVQGLLHGRAHQAQALYRLPCVLIRDLYVLVAAI